jgi:hypothetical protein
MTPLCLDTETLPLIASMEAPYPRDAFAPPSNYKLAEAIDGFHERNAKDWAAKREKECSVNPRLGRILCLSTDNGTHYAMTEAAEKPLLVKAWDEIRAAEGRVVTWNGTFDLRFLLVRSLANGIGPSIAPSLIRQWFKKYDHWQHFDVKSVLLNGDLMSKEGLDEWAKFFGLAGKPDGIDGGMVAWMYREGQHDVIQDYCESDRTNTRAMYDRLLPFFGGN